jgi:hypothetical protein
LSSRLDFHFKNEKKEKREKEKIIERWGWLRMLHRRKTLGGLAQHMAEAIIATLYK